MLEDETRLQRQRRITAAINLAQSQVDDFFSGKSDEFHAMLDNQIMVDADFHRQLKLVGFQIFFDAASYLTVFFDKARFEQQRGCAELIEMQPPQKPSGECTHV